MQQSLSEFLNQAWHEHADAPQAVGNRLPQAFELLAGEPAAASELARLSEHVLLAHLDRGEALRTQLNLLRPLAAHDPALALALRRSALALVLVDDDLGSALDKPDQTLPAVEQVRAHAQAALALTRRAQWPRIHTLLEQATRIAQGDAEGKALRALAAFANNLADDLRHYRASGDADQSERDALMLDAARLARAHWQRAGGWVEVERAEYQLALCHAAAGQGEVALLHARACLSICLDQDADMFELFFAHEAMSRAYLATGQADQARRQRMGMQTLVTAIDDAPSREYALTCLGKLDALLSY